MKTKTTLSKDDIIIFISIFTFFSLLGWCFLQKYPEYHLFRISGYDPFLPNLIKKPIESAIATIRHPLLGICMLPFHFLYRLILSDLFILFLFSFFASMSFTILYKIGYEIVGIRKVESLSLTLLFFSFSHILIMGIVPESYSFSMFFGAAA